MSNQTTPLKIHKTVAEYIHDDFHQVNQYFDREESASYTVLYSTLSGRYFGLVYDKKEDQYYQITTGEQYGNGQHQNIESEFHYFLSLNQHKIIT